MNHKITIIGAGYVGLSLAVLLSNKYKVVICDISDEKVKKINSGMSPIQDDEIIKELSKGQLDIKATTDSMNAIKDASYIIIATPTDYNDTNNKFDTSSVDNIIESSLKINTDALIVIKSTIPIGHTEKLQTKFKTKRIIYSPEFLREGKALIDNLNPSRIVIGGICEKSKSFAKILKNAANNSSKVSVLHVSSTEAEAIKLFSNTYLAMRVAFFNELDSFSLVWNLNSKNIIQGVSLDDRVGNYYNNPSFGYGGYCLPKDTKQLLSNYKNVPQTLIHAVVESNEIRKEFISQQILMQKPSLVGLYRLIMKNGSDNFRESAIISILENLDKNGVEVIIYEPLIKSNTYESFKVENNIDKFKQSTDLIIANRGSDALLDVDHKLFSRDLFGDN